VGVQIKLVGDPFPPLHLSYSEVNTEIGCWVSKRNREKKRIGKAGAQRSQGSEKIDEYAKNRKKS
jgi:hypothetical protein